MNHESPIVHTAQRVARHIERPYTLHEIAERIDAGDYGAEKMMQHLLLHVAGLGAPNQQAEPTALHAAAAQAIDAIRQTRRLYDLPDGHILVSAERALDTALRAVEDAEAEPPAEPVSEPTTNQHEISRTLVDAPSDAPTEGSAVEWVRERLFTQWDDDGNAQWYLCKSDALELARRADEAEKDKTYWMESAANATCAAGKAVSERNTLRAQLDAAQAQVSEHRKYLAAAQAEARELREALIEVLDDWKDGYRHLEVPDVYDKARAALDKKEGE